MNKTSVFPVFLRRGIVTVLSLLMVFLLISTAYADPTDEPPEQLYTDGTVHLTATVPEGFGGTVSVQLSNVESGELHTVTCYYSAGHEAYEVLPLGTYFVERAFTSEDSFVYEAFTEYFEFTLGNFQELSVNVTYNEGAQAFLDNQEAQQGVVSQQPNEQVSTPQEGDTTPVPEDNQDEVSDAAQPEDNTSDTPSVDTQIAEEEMSLLDYIGKVLLGTVIFTAIVFGVVFLVRKRMGE